MSGRTYDDYRFGDPPPSRKQFGYAASLGIVIRDGMTRYQISAAIDKVAPPTFSTLRQAQQLGIKIKPGMLERDVRIAIDQASPATADQLTEIRSMRGTISRRLTQVEADAAIEYLYALEPECAKCGFPISLNEDRCFDCGHSHKTLRIPIPEDALRAKSPEPSVQLPSLFSVVCAVDRFASMVTPAAAAAARYLWVASQRSAIVAKRAAFVAWRFCARAVRLTDASISRFAAGDRIVLWCLRAFAAFAAIGLFVIALRTIA